MSWTGHKLMNIKWESVQHEYINADYKALAFLNYSKQTKTSLHSNYIIYRTACVSGSVVTGSVTLGSPNVTTLINQPKYMLTEVPIN